MKRGIKVCLAVAGSLFALGACLRLAGGVMGGRGESDRFFAQRGEWLTGHSTWLPIDVSPDGVTVGGDNGICVDSDGVDIGGQYGIHVGHHSEDHGSRTENEVPEEITGIEVEIDWGDVRVREGDALSVALDPDREGYTIDRWVTQEGTLRIESGKWDGEALWGKGQGNANVTLTLPAGTRLQKLDLSTDMGDIDLDGDFFADEAELSTDMGDVTCRGLEAGELEAQSDLGDVSLYLSGNREDYTWELETSMGELWVDSQKQSGGMGELLEQGGSGQSRVEASSSLGDVKIYFSNR